MDSLARLAQETAETEVRNCVEAETSRIIASLSGRVETALEALRDILVRLAQEIAETEVFESTSRRTCSENLAPLLCKRVQERLRILDDAVSSRNRQDEDAALNIAIFKQLNTMHM